MWHRCMDAMSVLELVVTRDSRVLVVDEEVGRKRIGIGGREDE